MIEWISIKHKLPERLRVVQLKWIIGQNEKIEYGYLGKKSDEFIKYTPGEKLRSNKKDRYKYTPNFWREVR